MIIQRGMGKKGLIRIPKCIDFLNIPKRLSNGIRIKEIKEAIDEQYQLR